MAFSPTVGVPSSVAVFVMERSAPVTSVVHSALKSSPSGSGVPEKSLTTFVKVPVLSATTRIVMTSAAPEAMEGMAQARTPVPAGLPPGFADTKLIPVGTESITVTLVASSGPTLVMDRTYSMVSPASALGGPVLVTERSATTSIAVVTIDRLLLETGSRVVVLARATFVSTPVASI